MSGLYLFYVEVTTRVVLGVLGLYGVIGGGGGGRYAGGGGGGYPGGGTATNQVKEYKVFITKDTVLKLEDMDMEFRDLHVGDRVVVSGTPKGSNGDLDGTAVTRKF